MGFDYTNSLNSATQANNGDFTFTDRAGNTGDSVQAHNTAGEWCEDNGSCGTQSSGTGPQNNCPPAPASDGFIYTESSTPSESSTWAMKRTDSFDATAVSVTLYLHYNTYTETTARIYIEYATVASPNETTDWTILETIEASGVDEWVADSFDFSAIDNTTTLWLRVRCYTDNNYTNDLAFANWREVGVDRQEYEISGVTYDKTGSPLGSCHVFLCRDNGDNTATYLAHTTSNASTGAFTFQGPYGTADHFIIAWKDDSPHVFDATDHVLQGTEV